MYKRNTHAATDRPRPHTHPSSRHTISGVIRTSEFEFEFYHIEDVIVDMALRSMGITASEMTRLLLFGVFVLSLVSVFVFLGVSAFTTGTNFGAVINSFLPIISSTLLAVQALNKIRVASVK